MGHLNVARLAGTGDGIVKLGTEIIPGTTTGNNYLSIGSVGTAPSGTGADCGHLYADFVGDDDELHWLSGTNGTSTQITS